MAPSLREGVSQARSFEFLRLGRQAPWLVLGLGLLLGPGAFPHRARAAPASGADPAALLEQGREAYEMLECPKAVASFRKVLAHPKATPAQRVEAYVGQAWCQVVEGNEALARETLQKALEIRPDYPVSPDLSPKLAAVLEAAQRDFRARAKVEIDLDVTARGAPPELGMRVRDPAGQVNEVLVRYRTDGEWREVAAHSEGASLWTARLEGAAAGTLPLYVETKNRYGFVSGREGTAESPVAVRVEPAAVSAALAPPAATGAASGTALTPLAWTAAGLAVATVGAGTFFGLKAKEEEARFNGDPSQFGSHDEALAVGRSAQRNATTATVLFVSAGVLAATSGLLFVVDGSHGPAGDAVEPGFAAAAMPLHGGGLFALAGRF
ncbi:MAG: hypothetical protein D6729_19350 [Deltaproteobacteria bacterium]|nr:MAG: hypothetical protein D6729_19350 [Deltaproteobacteria bacterium]